MCVWRFLDVRPEETLNTGRPAPARDRGLIPHRPWETTAALESVLPPVELGTFAALTSRQKQKQLRDLAGIVTGIRLFNKHCGRGGVSSCYDGSGCAGKSAGDGAETGAA